MENAGYSMCEQCDEEYVFMDGSRCARCLSLSQMLTSDQVNEEESSVLLDFLIAA